MFYMILNVLRQLLAIFKFMHEHNPMLIGYDDAIIIDEPTDCDDVKVEEKHEAKMTEKKPTDYADKYLDKWKSAILHSSIELLDANKQVQKQTFIDLLTETKETDINYAELFEQATQAANNHRLASLITSYVSDQTPVGNVWMRYNHSKESFEYFSNHTIPYRYLEAVARKYVLTYCCPSLYVHMNNEIQLTNVPKHDIQPRPTAAPTARSTAIQPLFKQKQHKKQQMVTLPMKQRMNRYTWEGRFGSFSPLQKVPAVVVNKKANLSYADFKKCTV